jgi:hypothetical protein
VGPHQPGRVRSDRSGSEGRACGERDEDARGIAEYGTRRNRRSEPSARCYARRDSARVSHKIRLRAPSARLRQTTRSRSPDDGACGAVRDREPFGVRAGAHTGGAAECADGRSASDGQRQAVLALSSIEDWLAVAVPTYGEPLNPVAVWSASVPWVDHHQA